MTIEQQRRTALEDLREMLAEGKNPEKAVSEAASSSGLREDVVRKIGARLISEQGRLVSSRLLSDEKADRRRRADKVVQLYKEALAKDPDADSRPVEQIVGVTDFSRDEEGTLFLRTLDAWLDQRLKD